MTRIKLGLIGGGVMGEALLSRLIEQKIYQPSEVMVSEPQLQRRDFLAREYGVAATDQNSQAAEATEALLLAIKPQIFQPVVSELTTVNGETMVISILAGVSLGQLEAAFPQCPVVRVMPNTPAIVGAGMSAIAAGEKVQPHHLERAKQMLNAVGEVVEVPERLMDAVTGLSGSGPGYVAIMIEALADGGVAAGLPRAIAAQLALQTVLGTAQLLQSTKIHPAELKDRVTSPGGTTIAGVAQLEKGGLRSAIIEAVQAASQRSQELGG